jgi:hypothetical protein
VLQEVSKVFIGGDAKQPAAGSKACGELKIGEIGPAITPDQPVLFLGKIVVANAGAVQPPQRLLCRSEVSDVASRFDKVQCYPVDETAHQRLPAGPQQWRRDVKVTHDGKGMAFAME